MAQRRMINKRISLSEDISSLDILGQLLFERMILHADDVGLLPYSAKKIRAMCMPMVEVSMEDIGFQLEAMKKRGLIYLFIYEKERYWKLKSFGREQTLKKDRQPSTLLKIEFCDKPSKTWNKLSSIVEDDASQMEEEYSIGEDSIREEKGRESSLNNGKNPASPSLSKKEEKNITAVLTNNKISDISTAWQEQAFRIAEFLHIDLSDGKLKGRWLKFFKDHPGQKTDRIAGSIVDAPAFRAFMKAEHKIKYFFAVFYHYNKKPL